jgi:hypothetical protein
MHADQQANSQDMHLPNNKPAALLVTEQMLATHLQTKHPALFYG